jgi:hypothetical protein
MNVKTSTYFIFIDGTGQLKSDTKEIELNEELQHLKRKEKPRKKSLYLRTEEFVKKLNRKIDYYIKNKAFINNKDYILSKRLKSESNKYEKIEKEKKKEKEKIERNIFSSYIRKLEPYEIFLNNFEKEEERKRKKKENEEFFEKQKKLLNDNQDLRNKLRYYDFSKQLSRDQLFRNGLYNKNYLPNLTKQIIREKNNYEDYLFLNDKKNLCSKVNIGERIKYSKYNDQKKDILSELIKYYK